MTSSIIMLSTLLTRALGDTAGAHDFTDCAINGITANSADCRDGVLFVATKGATASSRNGHDFINQAVNNGAIAVVVDKDCQRIPNVAVPVIPVVDSKRALCHLVEAFYDFPSRKLQVIGITGTNGKTSTTFMLHNILKCAGFSPTIMGTLGCGDPGALTPLTHTTMDPVFISAHLASLARAGASHVIMEISSHALSLMRIEALKFAAVGLTNITQDHLDFHVTLENYRNAKARLFFDVADHETIKVLPTDQPFGLRVNDLNNVHWYEPHHANTLAHVMPFFGDFHLKNALLAHTFAQALGINVRAIHEGLRTCPSIPGRLEHISHAHDFAVFVDYAHTPHALRELFTAIDRIPHERLIVVFGCGGDREKEKRPMMGGIASEIADVVIITDDNPRTEDPDLIRQQILQNVSPRAIVHDIADRRTAISFALHLARKNDLVVIAGKGHENYQTYGTTSIPFSDQDEARKVLATL